MVAENEPDVVDSDGIAVGDIVDSTGVAIGHGARVEVHYHYEYIEQPEPGIPYLAPRLPAHHVPREAELIELRQLLMDSERQAPVVALRGMGGVGKTILAIAFCHDKSVLEAFPDGVLWATLGPDGEIASAQQAWAEALANDDLSKVASLEARASRLRSLLHGKTCLLVIDDVWEAEHLEHLQVGGQTCAMLVTTRERKIAMTVGDEYQLGVLKPEEAIDLLNNWAGKRDVGTRDEAAELANRLGFLPLALQLAGAQSLDDVKWADLLNHFRQVQGDLSALDMDEPKRRMESLKLAFDVSLERLDKDLQKCFERLGVFAAGREALFEAGAAAAVWQVTLDQAKEEMGRLVRAALLDRQDHCFALHLLVRDYAMSRLDEATRKAAEARHSAYYLEIAQHSTEEWQIAETALPQMRAAWGRATSEDVDGLCTWAKATNEFLHRRGHWNDNVALLKAAQAAVRSAGQRPRECWCEHELGFAYYLLGRFEEAYKQFKTSLTLAREVGNSQIEAQAHNRIGYFLVQQGRFDEANDHLQASLAVAREVGEQAVEAESLHLTGLIHERFGELDEALEDYRASRTIQHEVGHRRLEAATISNIGRIHTQRGELDKALDEFLVSLAIQRGLGDRTMEGVTLVSVGRIYEQRGELDTALDQFQAGLTIHREMGNQVWEAHSLNGIGRVYLLRNEVDVALDQFWTSLNIFREAGDQAGCAESLWNIGRAYEKGCDLLEAEKYLIEALAPYEVMGMPEAAMVREELERVRHRIRQGET